MGRKNSAPGKKRRLDRRVKGEVRVRDTRIERVPVTKLIIPDGNCTFPNPRRPKARFATEEKARAALEQAQSQRARAHSRYVEKRYYACPEGGCGGFHLTSREEYQERRRG